MKAKLFTIPTLLLYSLAMIIWGYFIFPLWSVMLIVWFAVATYAVAKHLDVRLDERQRSTYWLIIYLYPLIESIIKYMINGNVIAYSWFWLNRLEHFAWAVAMGLLLIPFLSPSLRKLSLPFQLLLYVGAVVIIGNLNEFFEYAIRIYIGMFGNQAKMAAFYWDTIYDLVINMLGSAFSFYLYSIFFTEKRKS